MLIGLDVGGTYTDAVLIDGDPTLLHAGDILHVRLKTVKAPTRPDTVLPGILEALFTLLQNENPADIRRVCVSSTLGLNALLTGRADCTGVLAVAGPGIAPHVFWGDDPLFTVLAGAQDHRGHVIAPVNRPEAEAALHRMKKQGAQALAVVAKFSPKNPEVEYDLRALAAGIFENGTPCVCGADVSGTLNFPRRLHTAYCNAALTRAGREFSAALAKAAGELGLTCPIVVLKADAGVFSGWAASSEPACTMGSGPAASLLGVWALAAPTQDIFMVDMGGTTTDLALMAGGSPLLAREGLTVAGRPTLIRSLWTRSIAVGGDSVLCVAGGEPLVGPHRLGPALALAPQDLGLRPPTLTDALNVLGHSELGDTEVSYSALTLLVASSGAHDGETGPEAVAAFAQSFVDAALHRIGKEARELLDEVNAKPVYTIKELLIETPIVPREAVLIGGPASAVAGQAEKAWGMPVRVPAACACANAVGAALARPTMMADLYADTLRGRMNIAALGIEKEIDRGYILDDAKNDAVAALAESALSDRALSGGLSATSPKGGRDSDEEAYCPQIVSAESFQMLDDAGRRGRIIKVRAQLPAGLLREGESV